ncbi:MAG: ATP-binding cassette domain-containing protein [Bacteroidia bacterium]|nr:ATP-binding cassette domain-containing protein [Bacteroidia bacterium]MCZ2247953.1 ATP-binding cassette domain-containing protein [Bacteroidia bacterium]
MEDNKVIEIKNVAVYQGRNLVLSHVNIDIRKGEFIYLIGKTGSGKSSLIKMLYADIPVKEGSIVIAGMELKGVKEKQIPFMRRRIGIIFQDFQLLYDRNVNENLIFVMKATGWKDKTKMESKCKELLSLVNLSNSGLKMPHELSGGEQQRVAIARALINDPEVILADEPTGNLDPDTSKEIVLLLKELTNKGCSVVMATHDFMLFNNFPARIIKCENGEIIDSSVAVNLA